MKLQILILLLFFSFFSAAQEFTYLHENHIFTISDDGSSFIKDVSFSGQMPAKKSQVISIYFTELETIKNIEVKITSFNNKERFLKKKDIVLSSVNTSNFYGGLQRYSFELPAEVLPYKVTYSYTLHHTDLMFLARLGFYYKSNKETIQYEIKVPNSHALTYKLSEEVESKKLLEYNSKLDGNYTSHSFISIPESRDTIAEKDFPFRANVQTIVHPKGVEPFAFYNKWYQKLVEPHSVLNETTKAAIDQEIEGLTTRTEKIAALFSLVQKRINYIDFENGIGAIQPRDVNDIFAKKQGDCKDMSNLLTQSLKYAGIEANMAISSTLGHFTDLDFPSLSSANHCICVVPEGEDYVFLDATESNGIFGFPSRQIQGRNVFVINDLEGELTDVPVVSMEDNKAIYEMKLVQKGIDLGGSCDVELNGMSQLDLKNYAQSTTETIVKQNIEAYYSRQANNLKFSDLELKEEYKKTSFTSTVKSSRIFTNLGKKYYLSLNFLPFPHEHVQSEKEEDKTFYNTQKRQFEITINLEQTVSMQGFEAINESREGIQFQFEIEQLSPRELLIKYEYQNENLKIEDEKLKAYNEINEIIRTAFAKTIVLVKEMRP